MGKKIYCFKCDAELFEISDPCYSGDVTDVIIEMSIKAKCLNCGHIVKLGFEPGLEESDDNE